ncbi:MAG: SDR family oxidoreductase [Acidimicrobiaceae bacterium]|jgi:7-alpha-hydroxysteroid dehydrogenase|nr:SDR family oxidoreductase [Acidimicrobiaceae bacterium]MBT6372472.1 SDR family oxidoreductase [Acidimicrobiaceae bacterium]MDG1464539.1 SDR family oxidoreductase [Acidimicrobiales bacterium]
MTDGALRGMGVLVTGGGTGIGRACAEALAADGAVVTICGRTEDRLVDAVDQIRTGHGGSVHHVVADVTSEDDVRAAVSAAAANAGSLRGVVANAGGGGGLRPLHLQEVDGFEAVLRLNVVGTMLCLKHAVPEMVEAGGGSFVGMSSIAGHVTHPHFGAYPVAKAGIEELMRNAADEFGASGVRCNAIRPGFIATELMDFVPRDSEVFASYVRNTPLAPTLKTGVGEPSDVGALARFLIGPESRWITGTAINVDGGQGLRAGPDFSSFLAAMGDDVLRGHRPAD